jgi:hypothetical protein
MINASGFQGGGTVDDVEGTNPQIHFIDQIAKGFGLQLTAGKSGHGTHDVGTGWHDSGAAGDFAGDTDHMLAFAMYMFEHYGSELAEIIFNDPRMTQLIKDGKAVDPQQVYGPWLPGHKNHVHIAALATSPMQDLSPGTESLSAGLPGSTGVYAPGSVPGGSSTPGMPGLAGQYGGGGAYGGETADEIYRNDKAVRDAQQRKTDLDYRVGQTQKRIDDLKDQLAHVDDTVGLDPSGKTGLLTGQPLPEDPAKAAADAKARDEKRKSLQDQLDQATHDLETQTRESADQEGEIGQAKRKQLEDYYKNPKAEQAKNRKVPGESEFQTLGQNLLGGIGESLGFGDLFDKPPWEWGAVKLLTGGINWAMGTANAWADEIGKGHTGMTGFNPIPGWDADQGGGGGGLFGGLAGSLGINLPKASISAGPNVVAGSQPAGPFGPPTGPLPGPAGNVIQGDYMPINVSPNVNPSAILGPVQEQRNSQNSTLHGMTGGLPQ